MIIWLASYPRSGNTFYRTLLKQVYGIPTHDIYLLRSPSTVSMIEQGLGLSNDLSATFDQLVESDDVHVVKTHDLPQTDYAAIYLVRDGRDALVSLAHFVLDYDRQLPLDEQPSVFVDTLRGLIENDNWFGGWSANVLLWTSRLSRTAVVRFEDLIQAPLDCLRQSMEIVGYVPGEIDPTHLPTFENLHAQFPQFFRTGRIGSWRDEMPADLHELFWQRHGVAMHKLGYT